MQTRLFDIIYILHHSSVSRISMSNFTAKTLLFQNITPSNSYLLVNALEKISEFSHNAIFLSNEFPVQEIIDFLLETNHIAI